jgi:hypothetical protein
LVSSAGLSGFQVKITDEDPSSLKTEIRLLHNSGDTITEAMLVADDSNVGIGVVSPSTKLDVGGVITANEGNSTQWYDAYEWGDHSLVGYITADCTSIMMAAAGRSLARQALGHR